MRAKMGAAWDKLSPRQKSWTMAATVALISVTAGYGLSQLGESGSQANGNGGSSSAECEDVLYWYDPMVPGQRLLFGWGCWMSSWSRPQALSLSLHPGLMNFY